MPSTAEAIISIRPPHAEAILTGRKTIELRRRIPDLGSGTRLWIYSTRPTAAIVGIVMIHRVSKAHPTTIWEEHGDRVAIDHASFRDYFKGVKEGVAILLEAARRVAPITIDQLRDVRREFHPPQVLTLLTREEAVALSSLAGL